MSQPLSLTGGGGARRWRGIWARTPVLTDFAYPGLQETTTAPGQPAPPPPAEPTGWREVEGELGGRRWHLRVAWREPLAWLRAPRLGQCSLDLDAGTAHWRGPAQASRHAPEVLAGPCLTLLLAARGCHVLHAAALCRERRALLILGPSGAGKTTLARALAAAGGWRCLGDDLAPVALSGDRAILRGTLPQAGSAPRDDRRGPCPLRSLVVLDPRGETPQLTVLEPAAGALTLARHTVAARLFSPRLLAAHLASCGALAGAPGVLRLSYAQRPDKLPAMLELLRACLET